MSFIRRVSEVMSLSRSRYFTPGAMETLACTSPGIWRFFRIPSCHAPSRVTGSDLVVHSPWIRHSNSLIKRAPVPTQEDLITAEQASAFVVSTTAEK
jgi:hypothetical protein